MWDRLCDCALRKPTTCSRSSLASTTSASKRRPLSLYPNRHRSCYLEPAWYVSLQSSAVAVRELHETPHPENRGLPHARRVGEPQPSGDPRRLISARHARSESSG